MRDTTRIMNLLGMDVYVTRSGWISLVGLAVLLSLLAAILTGLNILSAIVAGIVAACLHFLGEILHQYGHFLAAKATGYPMISVRLWFVLGSSIYPEDEPELPAKVHIRRALGGPLMSGAVTLVAGIVLLLLTSMQYSLLWWLVLFFTVDNLLTFTLGAFLPLGFTDGSTLLRYWAKD